MGVETIGRLNVASVDPISDASFTQIAKKKMGGRHSSGKKETIDKFQFLFCFTLQTK